MIPYWASIVLSIAFLLISRTGDQINAQTRSGHFIARDGRGYARWGVIASALVFIFLTGFRYGVGQDYFYTYVPYFKGVRAGTILPDSEIGFFALNWVVSRFTDSPTLVFLVCSIVFFTCTYAAIMKLSYHPIMSVFLIFGMSYLFIFMNVMRQMVAVSVLLYSIQFIQDRRPALFAVCVILAASVHISSLIFLVAYFLPMIRINIPICLALVCIFSIFKTQIAGLLNLIISKTQYAGYIGSVFDTDESGSVVIALNLIVLFFSLVAPAIYGKMLTGQYNLLLWCQLISTLIAIMSGSIPLSQRVRWVFSLSSIILLPNAIEMIEDEKIRFLVQAAVIILYTIYIIITIGLWNGNNVVPYQCVLFREGL